MAFKFEMKYERNCVHMAVYNMSLISCVLRTKDKSSENIFHLCVMSDNAKFARNEEKMGNREGTKKNLFAERS